MGRIMFWRSEVMILVDYVLLAVSLAVLFCLRCKPGVESSVEIDYNATTKSFLLVTKLIYTLFKSFCERSQAIITIKITLV